MTDQEQAPVDLAEGERLLAAYKTAWNANDGYTKEMRDAEDAWHMWLELNGRALVTALQAAQQALVDWRQDTEWREMQATLDLQRLMIETLRDDLARVEAERDQAISDNNGNAGHAVILGVRLREAQARNAELEAAVDMTPDYLGRTKLTYATEVIGLRKDLATEKKRIVELEGSLRELLDEHTTDTMIPYWEGDVQHLRYGNCECEVCGRARAVLGEGH